MKRLAISLMAMFLLIGMLAGCGSGKASDAGAPSSGASESSSTGTPTDRRSVQLGHINPAQDTDPYHTFATNFANNVNEAAGSPLEVDIIADAQLGAELSMMEGMQMGTIDMAVITNFTFSSFVPEFSVFDLPYIFTSLEHAHAALDDDAITGPLEDKLYDQFNIKILAWGEGGFRSAINKKHPISTVADFSGLKIRVPENTLILKHSRLSAQIRQP
jgi:TRAP-type C4-dicarboxylate transport system substrate-binding protein